MKKITDSAVFNQIVKNQKVMDTIKHQSINRDRVPQEQIEEQLSIIKKRMSFPTKSKTLNYLEQGNIVLVNNPEYSLPKYLTTMGRLDGGKIVAAVDISGFTRVNKTLGTHDIFLKTLFSLMQNGTILLEFFQNWNKYTNNVALLRSGALTYAKLVGKVMDKLFAISINNFKQDLVYFFLAKFFLVNMCDKQDSETVDNIAYSVCLNKSSFSLIKEEESKFDDNVYDSIFNLFSNMKEMKGFNSLNVRSFVENWARMYGEASLLSLDYLSYFYGMIFGAIVGGNINKDYIIESAAGKFMGSVYTEFSRILG